MLYQDVFCQLENTSLIVYLCRNCYMRTYVQPSIISDICQIDEVLRNESISLHLMHECYLIAGDT